MRVVLRTLTLAEIERLDAELAKILADRDQTWWARHSGPSEHWHLVLEVAGGSVVTACNGRWSIADDFDTEHRPARADRCGACQSRFQQMRIGQVAAQRGVDRGLVELRDATPTSGGNDG